MSEVLPMPEAPTADARLGEVDLHLFNEGTHARLHEKLGAHLVREDGQDGARFAVWAPSAVRVTVAGDFDGWGGRPLSPVGSSGIWTAFVPGVRQGARYKYRVTAQDGSTAEKADPVGFWHETPPRTASVVWDLAYDWGDGAWMATRGRQQAHDRPISLYEVHLGSWRRVPEEGNRPLGYRELAPLLTEHVLALGFTHVELMPVMEHPFYGSWGYQVTGYFAPTSRQGTPQDLMFLIDHLHRHGIGVVLDWVPAHFPDDPHGLARFDGTHLYEHADPKQGFHPDWKSCIFNYGRNEVRAFLISSARFWLDVFHADGLRVDGVASMLYLDYSRDPGEWVPNVHGGRENLEAIAFLRQLNATIYGEIPGVQTFAEESTAWPLVSRPVHTGGLGFGFKWDMGWMHDSLAYFRRDPVHRRFHHHELTFRAIYASHESFVLPLSHDEVVHGKGSLLDKMPGDRWQQRANLRLLLAWQAATPGKKLLFMGAELGEDREWDHESSLDWHLLDVPEHRGIRDLVAHLMRTYQATPALYELDDDPAGFAWVDASDVDQGVVSFLRYARDRSTPLLCVFHFTPVVRAHYRVGVPRDGWWREVVNTDAVEYGGGGQGNLGGVDATPAPKHGWGQSVSLTLPPLGAVWLEWAGEGPG